MKHTEYIVPIGEDAQDYDEMFIGVIRRQPELVRCKECKHYNGLLFTLCPQSGMNVIDDEESYCSWAERKEERRMKIGDECYVHGYVDEIRNDTIIIRNEGGYFGTAKSEVLTAPAEYVRVVRCKDCKYKDDGIDEDGIPFLKCLNGRSYGGTRINDYCSWAERKEE